MSSPLAVAEAAARAGGALVARHFRQGVTMRTKGAYDLVSDADVESEHAIVDVIRQAFPEHAILAEEAHRDDAGADHLWVIDPLDGTTNFAHGIPHVAVSIAYFEHGVPIASVIYNPLRDDCYLAARGEGATHNGRPVRVSAHERLNQSLIGLGFYYDRGTQVEGTLHAIGDLMKREIHCVRRFGCASLDLVMTGCGQLDAYFEFALSPWDFAGGWLFVESAGGMVTTCQGSPLSIRKTSVLASNGRLHDTMLDVLRPHLPGSA